MTGTDFQAASTKQGHDFEDVVAQLLTFSGWTVTDRKYRHPDSRVEIDIVAIDPDGDLWWIECKGADGSSKRPPGLSDGTTMKVAVGVAAHLSTYDTPPYAIFTSHMPKEGSLPAHMLDRALAAGWIARVMTIQGVTG